MSSIILKNNINKLLIDFAKRLKSFYLLTLIGLLLTDLTCLILETICKGVLAGIKYSLINSQAPFSVSLFLSNHLGYFFKYGINSSKPIAMRL